MSTETNQATVRRLIAEGWNGGDLVAAAALIAPDVVAHAPWAQLDVGPVRGRDAYLRAIATIRTAFPDLLVHVEDAVAEGDRVAVRVSVTGTQRGPLLGLPPTDRATRFVGMTIYRVRNGQIVEEWFNDASWDLMLQLGAREPGPPLASPTRNGGAS